MQDLQWALRSLRKSAGLHRAGARHARPRDRRGDGRVQGARHGFAATARLRQRGSARVHAGANAKAALATAVLSRTSPTGAIADALVRRRGLGAVSVLASLCRLAARDAEPIRDRSWACRADSSRRSAFGRLLGREFTDDENTARRTAGRRWCHMSSGKPTWAARLPLGTIRFGTTRDAGRRRAPARTFDSSSDADLYFPHEQGPGTVRSAHNYMVVGRLKPTSTLEAARAEMTALIEVAAGDAMATRPRRHDVDVRRCATIWSASYRTMLAVVFGAATLVLLIACTNLVSAQLARGWAREREVVIRAALGASRGRLIATATRRERVARRRGRGRRGGSLAHRATRRASARSVRAWCRGSNELTVDGRVFRVRRRSSRCIDGGSRRRLSGAAPLARRRRARAPRGARIADTVAHIGLATARRVRGRARRRSARRDRRCSFRRFTTFSQPIPGFESHGVRHGGDLTAQRRHRPTRAVAR